MPRQIIDTESSRPAYVRRRIATFVVFAGVAICVALCLWVIFHSHAR